MTGTFATHHHILWLGLAASVLVAGFLTLGVMLGWINSADRLLLTKLHPSTQARAAGKQTRLKTAALDFTALGGDTLRLLFLVGCMSGLVADGRTTTAVQLLAIFASARLMLFVLKAIARRPRPDVVEHEVVTYTTSFPSGHTLMSAALFTAAALLIPVGEPIPVREVMIALALSTSLLVAATRLALGIHWPSDILVGWFGGIAWATGCVMLIAMIAR